MSAGEHSDHVMSGCLVLYLWFSSVQLSVIDWEFRVGRIDVQVSDAPLRRR